MMDHIGQKFGNYRLVRLLGRGGFAEVYLGTHLHLDIQAAVKVLHIHMTGERLEQFRQEAQTIAHLQHPHIVRLLDFGIEQTIPFLVMDYASGGTLRTVHPRGMRLPLELVLLYITQVAAALQYAHEQRLIHRDVKPENMLLNRNHEIMLGDFGLAVVQHMTSSLSTQNHAGTPLYMAPEQIIGKPRPASDQYALGVVAYEWLYGKPPFEGSAFEVWSQHLHTPAPAIREFLPTLPPGVEMVLLKALAKDPLERFTSVQAFATALRQASESSQKFFSAPAPAVPSPSTLLLAPSPVGSRQFSFSSAPTPAASSMAAEFVQEQKPARHVLRRTVLWGLALGGVAILGGSSWVAASHGWRFSSFFPGSASPTSISTKKPLPSATKKPSPSSQTLSPLYVYTGSPGPIYDVKWSPHGDYIVCIQANATARIIVVLNGEYTPAISTRAAYSTSWSPDERVASANADTTVRIWDPVSGATQLSYTGHTATVVTVAWSPDGKRIASADKTGMVHVWDAATGSKIREHHYGTGKVYWLDWSPDSQHVATGGDDTKVYVWNANTGQLLYTYQGHSATVYNVAWSPDGKRIASASGDKRVRVWDATTGDHVLTYQHQNSVQTAEWSHNGKWIASSGADPKVYVWDASTGHILSTYTGHTNIVYTLMWSPDDTRIASSGVDGTAQVWLPGKSQQK